MKKLTFYSGILALGISVGAGIARYHHYKNDPDFFSKVLFDLRGEEPLIEKYRRNRNTLSELLLYGNVNSFKQELEKEAKFFKDYSLKKAILEHNVKKCDINEFLKCDAARVFNAYLDNREDFLREKLQRGYFLDAWIIAQQLGIDKRKIPPLSQEYKIQFDIDPIIEHWPLQQQNKREYENEIIIGDIVKRRQREWIMILACKLESIKELKGKDVLELYGETKKNIMEKARQRYREIKYMQDILSQEEMRYVEKIVED